jgi:large subunit ribosomal protein L18
MIKQFHANQARLRRHQRMRRRVIGSQERPRLNVFRSGQHIYAQIVDDTTGRTLAAASSLDESLRDFKPTSTAKKSAAPAQQKADQEQQEAPAAAAAAPARSKGAKAAPKSAPAPKGGKGAPVAQPKIVLPAAQKGERKTPVEALVAISDNRKVALAREVGKLVAQRAKEKGVKQVVFDRGGYVYHGRVASLAEGAREAGLDF